MPAPANVRPVLRHPLSQRALAYAFAPLQPEAVAVTRRGQDSEATVDGAWSLSRLRTHLKALGFKATGPADDLLFVNAEATVGVQCMGVEAHPTKNTWLLGISCGTSPWLKACRLRSFKLTACGKL